MDSIPREWSHKTLFEKLTQAFGDKEIFACKAYCTYLWKGELEPTWPDLYKCLDRNASQNPHIYEVESQGKGYVIFEEDQDHAVIQKELTAHPDFKNTKISPFKSQRQINDYSLFVKEFPKGWDQAKFESVL